MSPASVASVHPPFDGVRFTGIVSSRAGPLLTLSQRLASLGPRDTAAAAAHLTRPFLAVMLSRSTQLEELLDAYGADNNARWHTFRSLTATVKAFTRLHYTLLHLQLATPAYRLLPVEGDFAADTRRTCGFTASVLCATARGLMAEAAPLGLAGAPIEVSPEDLPPGQLPQDRARRHVESAGETIARLATAFLNLNEAFTTIRSALTEPSEALAGQSPPPDEATLRDLEDRSHNLQALYDTHVANTDVEAVDPELRSLRGHASIVFHLLEAATSLAHYYERHARTPAGSPKLAHPLLPASEEGSPTVAALLGALRGYALTYAARYMSAGRFLAQALLRRYAEQGEITVPVPRYRGFHVRPSTLVAKIVNHYGSPVSMVLEDETYDVSTPLELFRANEKINAQKRRWLAAEIARTLGPAHHPPGDDLQRLARRIIMTLAEQARIIVYEQPIPSINLPPPDHAPEVTWLIEEITRLQSLGKIDIATSLEATFRGDKRVLAEIRLLAEHGYGEDAHGNNIALPRELSYLRAGG